MLLTNRGQGKHESNNGFSFENVRGKLPSQLLVCRNESIHVGLLHQSKVARESGAPRASDREEAELSG